MHVSVGGGSMSMGAMLHRRQRRALGLRELQLLAVVNPPMWVLGTNLWTFEYRRQAIFSAVSSLFLKQA